MVDSSRAMGDCQEGPAQDCIVSCPESPDFPEVPSLASYSREWRPWGVRMKRDADAVSGKVAPHTQWTPAQTQSPPVSSRPHTALQERSMVAVCAHLGAPATGQKWIPCCSKASEAHPPTPLTLGTPGYSDCCPGGRAEVSWW